MKKILLAALTFLVTSVCLSAQGGRDFQKEFDEFLGKNQREFAQFQKRNEKQFVKFLEYAWAWFEGKPAEKEPFPHCLTMSTSPTKTSRLSLNP